MIPKKLHQTSLNMDWEEKRLAQHARSLMPDWDYHFWSDDANAALVRQVIPQFQPDYESLPSGVARTDIARCLYLFVHGGVYFDTDYRFFRPLSGAILSCHCVLGKESQMFVEDGTAGVGEGYKVGNAFMASEPNFPLWLDFIADVFHRFRAGEREILYLGGPHALTLFLRKNAERYREVTILSDYVLFPDLRLGNLTAVRREETLGVHLCWGSWRNKPLKQRLRNRARRTLSASLSYQNRV
jgi:mannosyltransferase OCH1-like enzyme